MTNKERLELISLEKRRLWGNLITVFKYRNMFYKEADNFLWPLWIEKEVMVLTATGEIYI